MCGIAGIVTRDGSTPDEGLIRRMMDAIPYRGRDGEGVWVKPGVGLGHRRLAIVDLSPMAAQPMSTTDGKFTIVYNGEIYNFRELRDELSRLGSSFRSTSDTEVILEAYRRWGGDSVKRLRGMFAFVIWDAASRRLFFARDRIGKKPFFYRILKNGSFAFASELKALIPLEPVTADLGALRQFIGLQYVPPPRTGFNEIIGVLQGHRGFADANGVSTESYHTWEDPSLALMVTNDPSKDILTLLDDAVKTRLLADVPVGAFLSGGVDSAAVVALATKHLDRPLRTFT
ncbi:MAG TPA: asparagine synthase (glutamine-hydrolyzing), partial [Candidatus Methylomirabilis sp.]|nr:asparagine synthase (glutamine-hydrolyzing) [Candidatus Methylomirabilis sp.]